MLDNSGERLALLAVICYPVEAAGLGARLDALDALAAGLDVALYPLVALALESGAPVAAAVGVGVGVAVAVAVGSAVGVAVEVGVGVAGVAGVAGVVGAVVAEGIGEGVACPRLGDGEGAGAVLAVLIGPMGPMGPMGPTVCVAGPDDGEVSRPIPATAPKTATARQTPPPAATARRRQRSRRPLAMILATSAGPLLPGTGYPGAGYPGSWGARRARRRVSRSVMIAPPRLSRRRLSRRWLSRRWHFVAGHSPGSRRLPPIPGAWRARGSWWTSRSQR